MFAQWDSLWLYKIVDSGGPRSGQLESTVSSSNVEEDLRGGKPKMGVLRTMISKGQFSLKRRRSGSVSRTRSLTLPFEDVRDAKDQQAVEDLRRELISRNSLPYQHDDFHELLRFVPHCSSLNCVLSCCHLRCS